MLWIMAVTVANAETVAATLIKGRVKDSVSGEDITGALVKVKGHPQLGAVSGLDGTFRLDVEDEECTLVCTCMGFKPVERMLHKNESEVIFVMEDMSVTLNTVAVEAHNSGRSEAGARKLEKESMCVLNVMSARAMELSSDVTVANAVRRMSGVTVERNSSGEGQYAILRGMDKRYNYTLVNGVKIPSPDNKNRFVPLDMFPSEMLDRLEVSKSLTADMEGDGIGGAVNLVMKDAPTTRQFTATLSTGYNAMYLGRDFQSFRHGSIARQSPFEAMGKPDDYAVTADDFTRDNLHVSAHTPMPDANAGLSYGDRFFGNRLGVMLAGTLLHTMRGKESKLYYQPGTTHDGTEIRDYSTEQTRMGAHLKLDYKCRPGHKLEWYSGYMDMRENEVRDSHDDATWTMRMRHSRQYIVTSALKGQHDLLPDDGLRLEWRAVASKAYCTVPDNAQIYMRGTHVMTSGAALRRWQHNSDRDLAAYVSLARLWHCGGETDVKAQLGAMYRDKQRSSFFNEFTFDSSTGAADPQDYGEDWTNFDQIGLTPRTYGNIGDPLNYDAAERIGAAYAMGKMTRGAWDITAGIRMEHTRQSYVLVYPRDVDPEGCQTYPDFLPSAQLRYKLHPQGSLHLTYNRSVNRPSFFEIVPYTIINEDYKEKGNPALEHTVADNLDLRYEWFPGSSEQLMVGLFYKHLKDPIEYGLLNEGQDTYYKPMNFGNATNMGMEMDFSKNIRWLGIKANYTYTHSRITTDKRLMDGAEVTMRSQTRPLFGQAAHVANLALLAKDVRHGWEGQVAFNYTGKRLSDISNWYDDDIWEKGFVQLDASLEKRFHCGVELFAKASNLLDTPLTRYIQKGPHTANVESLRDNGCVVERREHHGQTLTVGVRYKL